MRLDLAPVASLERAVREEATAASTSPFQMPAYGEALAAGGGEVSLARVLDGERVVGHALLLDDVAGPHRKWLGLAAPAIRARDSRAPFWSALVVGGRALGRLAATWREAPIARFAPDDVDAVRAACQAHGAVLATGALATYVVALGRPHDEIVARFEPRHRNRVRKATTEGVRVERAEPDEHFLDAFCALLEETYARSALVPPARAYLERLLQEPWALAYSARDAAGAAMAGAIITLHRGESFYLHGASVRGAHGASTMLQSEIMRDLAARGARSYDLGGIALPGSPGDNARTAGIREFKARFGGELRIVPSVQVKLDPAGYDAARRALAGQARGA